MADAETLREYYICAGFPPSLLRCRDVEKIPYQSPDVAAYIAVSAARAAFRAVPGLRDQP
jgi:hypothetical protein